MEGSRPGGIAPFPGMRISPEGRPPRQRAASGKFLREQDANPFFRQPPSIEACRVGRGSAARAAARPGRLRRSPRKTAARRTMDCRSPPRAGCYALTLLKAPAHRSLPVSEGSAAKAAARPGRPRRSPRKIAARRALCSCGTASGSSAVNKKSTVYPQASDSPVEERI